MACIPVHGIRLGSHLGNHVLPGILVLHHGLHGLDLGS
jgi:hypothetical protein